MNTFHKTLTATLATATLAAGVALAPTGAGAAPAGAIPKNFSISSDLNQFLKDPDVTAVGPSRKVKDVPVLRFCDVKAFAPAKATRRLSVSLSGPEWFAQRSLVGYTSVGAAKKAFKKFKKAATNCEAEGASRHVIRKARTKNPSVTVGTYYTDGLGSGITQVTRQGSWLLVVDNAGEGNRESLPTMARFATKQSNKLAKKIATLPGA